MDARLPQPSTASPTGMPSGASLALQRRAEAAEAAVLQLRAQLIARDTLVAHLRDERLAAERAHATLPARRALQADNEALAAQVQALSRLLRQVEAEADRQRRRAEDVEALAAASGGAAARPADRTVLCVGGGGAAPALRRLVERHGGRFVHHAHEGSAGLDASLTAADLVICQTGCLSHDAHWRVQQHCARTGKRCVFVHSPDRAEFKRALAACLAAA